MGTVTNTIKVSAKSLAAALKAARPAMKDNHASSMSRRYCWVSARKGELPTLVFWAGQSSFSIEIGIERSAADIEPTVMLASDAQTVAGLAGDGDVAIERHTSDKGVVGLSVIDGNVKLTTYDHGNLAPPPAGLTETGNSIAIVMTIAKAEFLLSAAASDGSRPALRQICFGIGAARAADGYRLHTVTDSGVAHAMLGEIGLDSLPLGATEFGVCVALAKALKSKTVDFFVQSGKDSFGNKALLVVSGNGVRWRQDLSHVAPDFQKIENPVMGAAPLCTVPPAALLAALKALAPIYKGQSNHMITLDCTGGSVVVRAGNESSGGTAEFGVSDSWAPGGAGIVALDAGMLKDALAVGGDRVTLSHDGGGSPVMIRPLAINGANPDLFAIVMPLRMPR